MRLLGRTGAMKGRTIAVAGPLRIGRSPENELQVVVDGVSRRHARVLPEAGTVWLEDLGSANGTQLNGEVIKRERLEHLDVITLVPGVDLIFDARGTGGTLPGTASAAAVEFEALDGPSEGARHVMAAPVMEFGRVAPAVVLIDSPVVSKLHARVRREANRLLLADLNSANGTFLNGQRISEEVALKNGDRLSIAGIRTFAVRVPNLPAPVAAAPASPQPVEPARAPVSSPTMPIADLDPPPVPAFDQEWRTKLVWSPDELAALDIERTRAWQENANLIPDPPPLPPSAAPAKPSPASVPPPSPPAPAVPPAPVLAARPTEAFSHLVPEPPASLPPAHAAVPTPPRTESFDLLQDLAAPAHHSPILGPSAPTQSFNVPSDMVPPDVSTAGIRAVRLRGAPGVFLLHEGTHEVGRQETAAVAVVDRQVSRRHARLTITRSKALVEDLGSANGTSVNGERVAGAIELHNGDVLTFGDVEFQVEVVRQTDRLTR